MKQILRWCYKTVHFELKKEGLLGGNYLDDTEVEESLNEFGMAGWELVSFMNIHDGVLAIFKQPIDMMVSNVEIEPKETKETHITPESYETPPMQQEPESFPKKQKEQPVEASDCEDEPSEDDLFTDDNDDNDDGVGVIRIE